MDLNENIQNLISNNSTSRQSNAVANGLTRKSVSNSNAYIENNRSDSIVQRKGTSIVDNRPRIQSSIQFSKLENGNAIQNQIVQKQASPESNKKENNTGLPDDLKSGVENLSGYSMDDVKVHYNSDKPAQLQARAYAQGTDIHLGPGQEKHLPHEAWHVVQQKQGRVQPTMQMKEKVNINDDVGLEQEADVMGAKALQMKTKDDTIRTVASPVAQKKSNGKLGFGFVDNRHEALAQLKQNEVANNSPQAEQATQLQAITKNHNADRSNSNSHIIQLRKVKLGDGTIIETDDLSEKQLIELIYDQEERYPNIAEKLKFIMDEPPTIVSQDGIIKINPDIMDEGLHPEPDFSREPIENDFHKSWEIRESNPFNRAHPNWLPPVPKELKGKERNDYMKEHGDKYPTVKVSLEDTFSHFTTVEGAEGMSETEMMYPSVDAGIQTTHYGRGVYFSNVGKDDLADKTHKDVTEAIYTRDSAENRRRSDYLAEVDMSDKLVLEYALRGKEPVFMHPTSQPIDVQGGIDITETSSHVIPDERPKAYERKSKKKKKKKQPKPPKAPNDYSYIVDWEVARNDYENAKWLDPETYGEMSFPKFLEDYSQDM